MLIYTVLHLKIHECLQPLTDSKRESNHRSILIDVRMSTTFSGTVSSRVIMTVPSYTGSIKK